ncbi:MAG TPA: hypothetical protein GX511_02925 [Firmicutes bacterium]|nr:hypothetical protein [Bacillota bacterium]
MISKGQGNYEGLSATERPVYFLLRAKWAVIDRALGVAPGEQVLVRRPW